VGKTEGTRGRGGGEVREKLNMLTLRCLCRVVGLGRLGNRHVVGNGRFRGHSVCTLYSSEVALDEKGAAMPGERRCEREGVGQCGAEAVREVRGGKVDARGSCPVPTLSGFGAFADVCRPTHAVKFSESVDVVAGTKLIGRITLTLINDTLGEDRWLARDWGQCCVREPTKLRRDLTKEYCSRITGIGV